MVSFPNAKINIGLRITEKRPDGFHNLQSCLYPVGWRDALEIIPAQTFAFSHSGLSIPGPPPTITDLASHNLCVRAYTLLKKRFDLPPVHIHLHKIIPVGAGLGGGSADAAFALKLLNERFDLGLSTAALEDDARQLGSDCAFFIQNRPAYCTEKGDRFENIDVDLGGYYVVLVYPNLIIATAEAYTRVRPHPPETSLHTHLLAPIETWAETVHNDFEDSLFPAYPILKWIKEQLYEAGAVYASLSGSGSTLFGIYHAPVVLPNQFSTHRVWEGKL